MKKFNKHVYLLSVFFLFFLIFQTLSAQNNFSQTALEEYLNKQETVFENISVQLGETMWNLYADEAAVDLKIPKQRFFILFHNDTLVSAIEEWYPQRELIADPFLRRRVEIWHNILTAARVNYEEEIFRLQTELEIWLTEEDSLIGRPSDEELNTMSFKLMKLRNRQTRLMGFADYAELVLETTEMGAEWFAHVMEIIDRRTIKPYQELIRKVKEENEGKELEFSDIRPYLLGYYAGKRFPDMEPGKMHSLMETTLANIGIAYDKLPARFVVKELPSLVGGQGIAVQIPGDFRAVVRPDLGLDDRMHELGHGLQWMFTGVQSPILKGYEWCIGNDCGAYAEGMAETCAGFVRNPNWLKKYAGLTDEEIATRAYNIKEHAAVYLRYQLMIFMTEIGLYRDLSQDYAELQNRIAKKYLLLEKPLQRSLELANLMFVSYPIYVQNYLLADIVSWQIHSYLEERFGVDYVFNESVGQYLIENLYQNGEFYSWQEKLKKATGKELDVEGYLQFLGL